MNENDQKPTINEAKGYFMSLLDRVTDSTYSLTQNSKYLNPPARTDRLSENGHCSNIRTSPLKVV